FSLFFYFVFSSRRRHTRCYRDWSSDVCSSDLPSPAMTRVQSGAFSWAKASRRRWKPLRRMVLPRARMKGCLVRVGSWANLEVERSEERRVGKEGGGGRGGADWRTQKWVKRDVR